MVATGQKKNIGANEAKKNVERKKKKVKKLGQELGYTKRQLERSRGATTYIRSSQTRIQKGGL